MHRGEFHRFLPSRCHPITLSAPMSAHALARSANVSTIHSIHKGFPPHPNGVRLLVSR